jgi:CheY-like chemotaxis protein
VSRILVADDNSNIQKMVALALKDEGIDVVAVGNGDAAMRKIPDLRPDLVLADIFMPVRNGYEVCEFVKSDSRYMNTPVVLLVGAFDPLDEQETQRVRADGVLKKPFVPPDPLINMVKALLAKSNGQKAVPVPAATPAKTATPPQIASAPASQAGPSSEVQAAPAEELVHHPGEISSSAPGKPPAFKIPARPPESQTAKAEDPDEVVTSARDPNLGEPFWATPAEAEEPEERSETQPEDMLDLHSFGQEESSLERDDEPHFQPDSSHRDSADYGIDLGEMTVSQNEAGTPKLTNRSQPAIADEDIVVAQSENEAASSSSAPPETPPELLEFDPTLTFPTETQNAPIEEKSAEADGVAFELDSPVNDDAATPSWPAVTDSTAETPAAAEKPLDTHVRIQPVELELPSLPNRDEVITAATEAARLAFSELNTLPGSGASAESSDRHASGTEQATRPASAPANAPPSPTPEMIEAVVNRMLERMQPEIMEVVNREVLRPAIEAIVRREMKKG